MESKFDEKEFGRIAGELWKEKGPFSLFVSDEVPHHEDPRIGPEFFEYTGFFTLAESNGEILYIQPIILVNGGAPKCSLSMLHREYDNTDKMHGDTELFASGDLMDQTINHELTVNQDKDRVIWQCPNFRIISQPPVWHLLGTFKDEKTGNEVKLDLLYKQETPEFWLSTAIFGPKSRGWGVEVYGTIEGDLFINNKIYEITSPTVHERYVMPFHDPSAAYQGESGGIVSNGDQIKLFYGYTGYGGRIGMVYVQTPEGGQMINFEDITSTVTEWWGDPQTGLSVPCKWKLVMKSLQRGTLEASLAGFDRNWLRPPKLEKFMHYMYLISIDSKYTFPNGETVTGKSLGIMERTGLYG